MFFSLIEVLRGVYLTFPHYDRYLISYRHNRSAEGFIRLSQEDLKDVLQVDNATLLQRAKTSGEIMALGIQTDEVDEQAYKFHLFPRVKGFNWSVKKIQDCSIENHKRLKGNLILEPEMKTREIKQIIKEAIQQVKKLNTPKNPRENLPFGDLEADAVFLNVFYKVAKRKSFDLFPGNPYFICIAHYYSHENVPRLKDGSLPKSLWIQYRKEYLDNIDLAWNPNFKSKK